jgi:formamidopyrimidine-DNA glycosylase
MPELPEVELVRRQLVESLELPQKILKIEFSPFDLRNPMPRKQAELIENQIIVGLERRAKYILFNLESGDRLVTHLGMTGSWRFAGPKDPPQKHDHVMICLSPLAGSKVDLNLIYNDPRRFGFFEFCEKKRQSVLLKNLGPEPLEMEFSGKRLHEKIKSLKSPIKSVIMNSRVVVVGVGNIYASEALFRAKISPFRKASKIKIPQAEDLVQAIKEVLNLSLDSGGSSIDNYKHVSGKSGEFQNLHQVYNREGLACKVCESTIKKKVLTGRSTFWCSRCQK